MIFYVFCKKVNYFILAGLADNKPFLYIWVLQHCFISLPQIFFYLILMSLIYLFFQAFLKFLYKHIAKIGYFYYGNKISLQNNVKTFLLTITILTKLSISR